MATVLVPKEWQQHESRVAATPETVKKLCKLGLQVCVESNAGQGAFISDEDYVNAGASIVETSAQQWSSADIIIKVAPLGQNPVLGAHEASLIKEGALLIALLAPFDSKDAIIMLRDRKVSSLPMEMIPRISRAQSMDALSSQASIAGYKAVLLAAAHLPSHFPLLMTAAGTVKPAKVVIMGAGVAGLQAVATAKRLGATVEVSDIRPEVQEQVESLGAKFIDLPELESGAGTGGYAKEMGPEFLRKQREIVSEHIKQADVVITTALVPGRPAPKLVSKEMVSSMKKGSVIVDLAVAAGGNCEFSELDKTVVAEGVTIIGDSNLPATVSKDASQLYARNVFTLLELMVKDGNISLDLDDEIIAGTLLTYQGSIRNDRIKQLIEGGN
ncbi:MAG: Re/Si-specific NAD(P)(+) transhydrogenase subunit alpha [Myxococcales bacterium]|nr:MAG: Re/Si-specific NAD(P)(+) transhydrogenase subunit alpha [Myxococcales bacterium]